jgi:hypothetical protein
MGNGVILTNCTYNAQATGAGWPDRLCGTLILEREHSTWYYRLRADAVCGSLQAVTSA